MARSDDAVRNAAVEAAISGVRPSEAGWYRVDCPFCDDARGAPDTTRALAVSSTTGWYRCWRCHTSGRLHTDEFVPQQAALRAVAVLETDAEDETPPPPGFEPLSGAGTDATVLSGARAYLRNRGIGQATINEAGIGACVVGRYARRVVIPHVIRGRWVGWVARSYDPKEERRYLYPAGMSRRLWNEGALHVEGAGPLMVVEGVFDALPYWPDAVACLGKPTRAQITMLEGARRPLVIVLDGDAWREAEALALRLRYFGGVRHPVGWVKLPPKQDPGAIDRAWLRRRVIEAAQEPASAPRRLD